MRCLEILLNGEVICRAGDEDLSLLTATLHLLPDSNMQRLIVSGDLKRDKGSQLQRWLDMSPLKDAVVSFRIVDAAAPDAPSRVNSFGTLPGYDEEKYFCSFCGAAGEDTPLMCGPGGNICPRCVKRNLSWADEKLK